MQAPQSIREPNIEGADPHPRKPRVVLPPGACDCHAHVFGPQTQYPYAAAAKYIPPDATTAQYIHMLKTLGLTRAVLVQPSVYGTDNTAMTDAMKSGLFEFRGVAVVNPDVTDAELDRLHAVGVRGVRLNLFSVCGGGEMLDAARNLAARLAPRGWHLQFYVEVTKTPGLEDFLNSLPLDFVIDHFGHVHAADGVDGAGFQTLLRLARNPKCWFKVMGPYRVSERAPDFPDVTPLARALVAAAPDRVVWGTDWPHPNIKRMPNDGDLADLLTEWVPDVEARRRLLVDNPARLYQFPQ